MDRGTGEKSAGKYATARFGAFCGVNILSSQETSARANGLVTSVISCAEAGRFMIETVTGVLPS
jgi:hypothetical protein